MGPGIFFSTIKNVFISWEIQTCLRFNLDNGLKFVIMSLYLNNIIFKNQKFGVMISKVFIYYKPSKLDQNAYIEECIKLYSSRGKLKEANIGRILQNYI